MTVKIYKPQSDKPTPMWI